MDFLVIGGSRFVGRHLVEAALADGHNVTLFNRGKTNPGIYQNVEEIHGDRDGGLDALGDRTWDAVFDVNGYVPRIVRQSANTLKDRVGRYVFVSSISVYSDMANQNGEDNAPLHTLDDPTVEEITPETYGGLKVLCEKAVTDIYGDRALNVRPGFVVGRYDYSVRLPYLVTRFMRGGERLVGRAEQPVQLIHARDLGDWMVLAVINEISGQYNLTGHTMTMQTLVDAINRQVDADNSITNVTDEFLQSVEMTPIEPLSYWIPPEAAGIMEVTIEKAFKTGLQPRDAQSIVTDFISWNEVAVSLERFDENQPISAEREAELLQQWHMR